MGSPKALLELDGRTFLERAIEALREGGCDPVIVVAGAAAQRGSEAISRSALDCGAMVAVNPHPASEQIDSIRIAVRAMPDEVSAVVVTPVDAPRTRSSLVARLIGAARTGAPIAVPSFAGRRGHPILFAQPALGELFDDLPDGARSLIHRHENDLVEVPAETGDILLDIDTPEDYRRLKESGA